jgi:hypothetical protein
VHRASFHPETCRGKRKQLIIAVMAGLVPAISLRDAQCPPKRDARHKAGHDDG